MINNLLKIKDEAYVINFDEYKSIGTHSIALYVDGENLTSSESFEVEHIAKELKRVTENKNITTNIYRYKHTTE